VDDSRSGPLIMARLSPKRWPFAALGSLVLHVGIIGAVLVGQALSARPRDPPASMVEVGLLSMPSAAPAPVPAAGNAALPPEPLLDPQIPVPDEIPIPDVQVDLVAEADVQAARVQEPQSLPDLPARQQTVDAAPIRGDMVDPVRLEEAWERLVLAALERKKRYPASAQRRGQQDTVHVQIIIDRSGNVLEARVLRSMHNRELDTEAVALVHRASPLPAPPDSILGESIDLVVPVEFFIRRSG
jgi:protein TonB